jgi:hypothetical protein
LTQEKNYAQGSKFNPIFLFHFFNELATERKTMLKAFISFFNELSKERKNYARRLFLIMASKRMMLWKDTMSRDKTWSCFQEIFTGWKKNALEGTHVEGLIRGKETKLQYLYRRDHHVNYQI